MGNDEYSNKPKGVAVEYKVKHQSGTACGYSLDGEFKALEFEISNREEILKQELQTFEKIADEFQIPLKDWNSATFKLARKLDTRLRHYTRKESGRPKTWNELRCACLWFDIRSFLNKNPGHSTASACLFLSKQTQWNGHKFGSLKTANSTHVKNSALVEGFAKIAEQIGWENFAKSSTRIFSLKNRDENIKSWDVR